MIADLAGTQADGQLTLSVFMVGLARASLFLARYRINSVDCPWCASERCASSSHRCCARSAEYGDDVGLRGLQGAAAASGPVIARAIVRDRYEGNRAAQVMSALSGAMAVIPMVAPSIGVLFLRFFQWPSVFLALALFALIILTALIRFPETAQVPGASKFTIRGVLKGFGEMLFHPTFLGYQLAGSFSFAALFCYLSTVAYFLPDVFNIPTEQFGVAFALTVLGFMTGSLINARVVIRFGLDATLRTGLLISLLTAAAISLLAHSAGQLLPLMAGLSSLFSWVSASPPPTPQWVQSRCSKNVPVPHPPFTALPMRFSLQESVPSRARFTVATHRASHDHSDLCHHRDWRLCPGRVTAEQDTVSQ